MVSEFDLNAEELDSLSEDDVKADLCITPSFMQRIEDRAAKFKVDDVPRDLAVNTVVIVHSVPLKIVPPDIIHR